LLAEREAEALRPNNHELANPGAVERVIAFAVPG
jgi:hypothetical protein